MRFKKIDREDIKRLSKIVGKERISQGMSNLKLHSLDQSHHRESLPDVVIWPVKEEEVSEILSYANKKMIPVTAWGAGTSLEGNPIPLFGGIVLDFTLMNRILRIREEDFQADVQPGVIYQDLNYRLRHRGLFFPPDPGARATIGGIIANNASGIRSLRYGSARDNVLRLRVVLADGSIIDVGTRANKSSSGYDLLRLFVGSEGTLGIFVEATVRLRGIPEYTGSAIASFEKIEECAEAVTQIIKAGIIPACLEIMDQECIKVINKIKGIGLSVLPTLLLELHGGSSSQIKEEMEICSEICFSSGCKSFRKGLQKEEYSRIMEARYSLGESIRKANPGRIHTVLDVAVPISSFPELVSFAKKETERYKIPSYIFAHAGSGNLHLAFMGKKDEEEWKRIEEIKDRIVEKAILLGGTATGEHGVGIGKRKYMKIEHGEAISFMKKIKKLFDPNGILNPGKIFP